jgi:hypothetical protein
MIEPFEGDKVKFNRDKTTPYYAITSVRELGLAHGYEIELEEEPGEYIIFETRMDAGEAAREVYENMVHDDPSEFRAIVGDETLVSWAMGIPAGPGNIQVNGIKEWLDLWLYAPEEEWARYDGEEIEGRFLNTKTGKASDCVMYRSN